MNIDDLVGEFDAYKWADGWMAMTAEHPEIARTRETMHTWFANAIMSGFDRGVEQERKRPLLEKLHEVIFQAAGAATAPLLEDNPKYVFPSERVVENVERVLTEFGIPAERHEWALARAAVPREQGYPAGTNPPVPIGPIGIATKQSTSGTFGIGIAGDFDALTDAGCQPVMADGGLISKEVYPELCAMLGSAYGEPDGEMFRLPNFQARVVPTDRLDRATHAEMAPPDPKRSAYHNPPTEEER